MDQKETQKVKDGSKLGEFSAVCDLSMWEN